MRSYESLRIDMIRTARLELINGLDSCTEWQRLIFKKMYANGNLELPIRTIVLRMPANKLEWAMLWVERELDMGQTVGASDGG